MKNIIYLLFLILLSCNDDSIGFTEPLDEQEKSFLKLIVSNMNQDTASVFYEKMLAMGAQTINLSTKNAVLATPLYKEVHNFFQDNLDNFPLLFDFILYDKRCTGEINSNARLLLWEIAGNNFKTVTEELYEELIRQKTLVDGVKILTPEVKLEYDVKLIKALLPYFK
ncbi:MAG: hypothetical protein ACP5D9_18205 [Mariniphaga sp.]